MILRNGVTLENLNNKAFLQANKFNLNLRLTYHEYVAEKLEMLLNKFLRVSDNNVRVLVNETRSEAKIFSNRSLKSVLDLMGFDYVVEKKFNNKFVYNVGYTTYI